MELFLELEVSFLKMGENIRECGKIIKWMDMDILFGQMKPFMKENSRKIKKKVLEFIKQRKKYLWAFGEIIN